jgi:tRNA G18 (ribose-2'-O)-methylase SpoU
LRRKLKLDELNRASVADFKRQDKFPIVVVCDNIRSAMNIGSFFRTADALAIDRIVLCGISARPPHKEINKTAIGATESVMWEYKKEVGEVIHDLKNEGYFTIAIEQTSDSVEIQNFEIDLKKKYALIFGNEIEGVTETGVQNVDLVLEIPQFGTKHSFNVAVCGGIVMWEFVRAFLFSKK